MDRLDKNEMNRIIENSLDALKIDRTKKLKIKPNDLIDIIKLNHNSELITIKDINAVLKVFCL